MMVGRSGVPESGLAMMVVVAQSSAQQSQGIIAERCMRCRRCRTCTTGAGGRPST